LPNNYKLKELYLGGNFIDKKGIAALCDVLKQNNTLQKLSLRDSDLPKVISTKEMHSKHELKFSSNLENPKTASIYFNLIVSTNR
jgi:hypothetical protein